MLVIIVALFVFFITMLRKKKLDLKYCLVWLIALLGVALFCAFPTWLDSLSGLLGIAVPVFTLFLICIAFLTCICISLTIVVSRLSDRLRKLTQNIAILECENSKKEDKGEIEKRNEEIK
jgi:hypothetical protein